MRIITCASYYGTGSSAVTDLFSGCEHILSLGDYEYRFLQEPDGISDLEYNIVENNHRHNTSDAIKRFVKFMRLLKKMGYGGYDLWGEQYETLVQSYVSHLVELEVFAWCNKDRIDKGKLFYYIDRLYSLMKRLFTGNLNTEKKFSLLHNREKAYFTAISEEEFLKYTKEFVDAFINVVNKEKYQFVMVDQMVPPTNLNRYIRYFNDVRVIVVDRDPRDVFILEKYVWQWGVIPVKDVKEYVEWFKITRKFSECSAEDRQKVCRIKFEDMIYNYNETVKKLFDFVGIEMTKKELEYSKFDPNKSIHNTDLKNKINVNMEEIRFIEQHLSEYLYDFEKYVLISKDEYN